jgi:hypothetical protein
MTHIAIQDYLDGEAADWMEKVSNLTISGGPDPARTYKEIPDEHMGEQRTSMSTLFKLRARRGRTVRGYRLTPYSLMLQSLKSEGL